MNGMVQMTEMVATVTRQADTTHQQVVELIISHLCFGFLLCLLIFPLGLLDGGF